MMNLVGVGTILLATGASSLMVASAEPISVSGNVDLEVRYFPDSPNIGPDQKTNLSISGEVEFYRAIGSNGDSIRIKPFLRVDENDNERTHFDIREAYWQHVSEQYELTVGINQVFWGVTETRHLVNIVNQIDLIESGDEEELLGQPMVHLTLFQDQGSLEFFVLPFFRERNFPGRDGRPGAGGFVDTDRARFAVDDKSKQVDFAVRWSRHIGVWDLGVSYFSGLSREPRFELEPNCNPAVSVCAFLPVYETIDQFGLDVQATSGAWLWKLEAIHRDGQSNAFGAAVAGFEYTFYDVSGSGADIGVVTEYLFDERDFIPYNNDISIGARITLNDINSTALLAGIIIDLDNGSNAFSIEASRRIGDASSVSLEARAVGRAMRGDPLELVRDEDYLELKLTRSF